MMLSIHFWLIFVTLFIGANAIELHFTFEIADMLHKRKSKRNCKSYFCISIMSLCMRAQTQNAIANTNAQKLHPKWHWAYFQRMFNAAQIWYECIYTANKIAYFWREN